ncbi:2Fe-2S iron-sulfur cluster-binding protein [Paenibacillus tarimensis]
MIQLIGQSKTVEARPETGVSLLDLALKFDIDWAFSCTRGTCARCRCRVEEGAEFLEEVTDAEWDRLDEQELSDGYRLACQAIVKSNAGSIVARNVPYF